MMMLLKRGLCMGRLEFGEQVNVYVEGCGRSGLGEVPRTVGGLMPNVAQGGHKMLPSQD